MSKSLAFDALVTINCESPIEVGLNRNALTLAVESRGVMSCWRRKVCRNLRSPTPILPALKILHADGSINLDNLEEILQYLHNDLP